MLHVEPSNAAVIRSQHRYHWLDGLRGVAAALVVLHHCFISYDFSSYTGDATDAVHWNPRLALVPFQPGNWGNMAVCVFFLISGFVLSSAYVGSREYIIEVVFKRYIRLTIPVVVGCLLGYAVIHFGFSSTADYVAEFPNRLISGDIAQSVGLLDALKQGLVAVRVARPPHHTYNGVIWTMPIEFLGSILVLLYARAIRLRPRLGLALLALFLPVCITSYMALFTVGALAFALRESLGTVRPKAVLIVIQIIIGFLLATFPTKLVPAPLQTVVDAYNWLLNKCLLGHAGGLFLLSAANVVHAFGASVLFVGLFWSHISRRLFESAICQWLGFISFPLYLVHVPVIQVIFYRAILAKQFGILSPNLRFTLAVALTLVTSLVVAHAFAVAIEVPVIRLVRRIRLQAILGRFRRDRYRQSDYARSGQGGMV